MLLSFVVCRASFAVVRRLSVAGCYLQSFVVCNLLFVVCWLIVVCCLSVLIVFDCWRLCSLFYVCGELCNLRCWLFVACCGVCGVCCWLFVDCRLFFVVCGLLSVAYSLLVVCFFCLLLYAVDC